LAGYSHSKPDKASRRTIIMNILASRSSRPRRAPLLRLTGRISGAYLNFKVPLLQRLLASEELLC
jgi:hypothetical protein